MFEESKALVSRWIEARNTNKVDAAVAHLSEDWHNR